MINITIPPLRERKEDIEALSAYFLRKYSRSNSKDISGFEDEVVNVFGRYHWPGNVRELENVIERAVILCDRDRVGVDDISLPVATVSPGNMGEDKSLEGMEKDYIFKVLREANGNQSVASQVLGIDRKTLYLKLKKYGVNSP